MKLNQELLMEMALGAEYLGSGGGGKNNQIFKIINNLMNIGKIPELIDIDDVPKDSLIIGIAYLGNPSIIDERIPVATNILSSLKTLENHLGEKTYGIVPIQGAGIDALIPFIISALYEIPVINADGMGRAFSELDMTTFYYNGVSITPMTISNEFGNNLFIENLENNMIEDLLREITLNLGGGAWISAYPMSGEELKNTCIKGTLTKSISLGELLLKDSIPLEKLKLIEERFNGKILIHGITSQIFRYREGRFAKGDVYIKNEMEKEELKISFQNEYLLAYTKDKIIAQVPEIINLIDSENLSIISPEEIMEDQEVFVLKLPFANEWQKFGKLNEIGPKRFGYNKKI